jgi:hypothetical protein
MMPKLLQREANLLEGEGNAENGSAKNSLSDGTFGLRVGLDLSPLLAVVKIPVDRRFGGTDELF